MNWSHIHSVASVSDLSTELVHFWQERYPNYRGLEVGLIAKTLSRARYCRQAGYALIVTCLILLVWLVLSALPGWWPTWLFLILLAGGAAAVWLIIRAEKVLREYLWEGERVCEFVGWFSGVIRDVGFDPPDPIVLCEMLSWDPQDLRTHARNHLGDLATRQLIPEQWVGVGEAPTLESALERLQSLGLVASTDTAEKFLATAKERLGNLGVS